MNGRRAYPYLLAALDVAGLLGAIEAAVRLRVALNPWFEQQFTVAGARQCLPPIGVVLAVTLLAGVWVGLYRPAEHFVLRRIFLRVPKAAALACMTLGMIVFLTGSGRAEYARSLVILYVFPAAAALAATPLVLSAAYRLAARLGWCLETVAIVGTGPEAADLGKRLERMPATYRLAGYMSRNGEASLPTACVPPERVLGPVAQLDRIINAAHLDHVVLCDSRIGPAEVLRAAVACEKMDVVLDQRPQTSCLLSDEAMAQPSRLAGCTVLRLQRSALTRRQHVAKRLLDLGAAALAAPVVVPLAAGIALAVKLTSRGPVLHAGYRVGRGGRHFQFYKFRSMYVDAEARRESLSRLNEKAGRLFKMRRDPRVTPVGRVLRRLSLDELPQLWNIVRGDMSFVGPRPLPAADMGEAGFCPDVPLWSRVRMNVLPGITGLWQVSGRSDLPFEEMVRLDLEYVRRWSLWLDLKLLVWTVPAALAGRGAY